LRAVGPIVRDAAADGAGFLGAFGTSCTLALGVDVYGWDPGITISGGAVDAIACWNRPFCFSFLVFFLHGDVNVWHYLFGWDCIETTLGWPLSFGL